MQPGLIVRGFVASPSDVADRRNDVNAVVTEWNAVHSLDRAVLIEAVKMETHAQLAQDAHPQDVINRQLLDRCDFLVGIFKHTLGTPTGRAPSGTIQEIDEFIARKGGSRVLLFFSTEPVPQDADQEQWARLREFKHTVRARGLYREFKDAGDFVRQLVSQLAIVMNAIMRTPIVVGYRSVITLSHGETHCRLHSHGFKYKHAGSSGQQQVTGFCESNNDDYWIVKGRDGSPEDFGKNQPVRHGDIIRLEHWASRTHLHSHFDRAAPLVGGEQEVTAFDRRDTNDDWQVHLQGRGEWLEGEKIRLIHHGTQATLRCHAGVKLAEGFSQLVVSCTREGDHEECWWTAQVHGSLAAR